MKVVILAGGLGTRLSEYTHKMPKPMVKVAGYPMVTHIMKHYMKYGFNDFLLATGYKSKEFKKYFKNYKKEGKEFNALIFKKKCKINIINTGLKTLTGGRIKKSAKYLDQEKDFMFTYGDGVSNVNLKKLVKFHKKHGGKVTVTAVRPPARFGELKINKDRVKSFKEKPQVGSGWINGGFFVAKLSFISFIKGDYTILEKAPLEQATKKKELYAFKHNGFWKCMDTKRDKDVLEKLLKK
jgi:glucose-1-phosphate cytidylyltransferase